VFQLWDRERTGHGGRRHAFRMGGTTKGRVAAPSTTLAD
jgi:hypothetical protein